MIKKLIRSSVLMLQESLTVNKKMSGSLFAFQKNPTMKKLMNGSLFALAALGFQSAAMASPSLQSVHTWDTVVSKAGNWQGTLASISEHATFVTQGGLPLSQFLLTQNHPVTYGFSFGQNDDFNVAYTLTLVQSIQAPSHSFMSRFTAKTCVFVVTATAPATPDIRTISYYGAACAYETVPGVGDNFYVS